MDIRVDFTAIVARSVGLRSTAQQLRAQARSVRAQVQRDRLVFPHIRRFRLARGASDAKPSPPRSILVVDDSADGRLMYSMYLTHHGFTVLEAADGEEALALAAEHRPTLILMDLGLPKMDGWEATRRLKSDPRTQHILVFALSGHAFPDSIDRAKQAGVDVFLRKPVTPAGVLERVRALLEASP